MKKTDAMGLYRDLEKLYPNPKCGLNFKNPYQLLVATILSAQCTDKRVNKVTPDLFKKYPDFKKLKNATHNSVEKLIYSTGFYKNKTKNLIALANKIEEELKGFIPRDINILIKLPGIGRKTANVLLGNVFHINQGVVVDTHVKRISSRLRLTKHSNPEKVEQDLIKLFPQELWTNLSHLLIAHGREICFSRNPNCEHCFFQEKKCNGPHKT